MVVQRPTIAFSCLATLMLCIASLHGQPKESQPGEDDLFIPKNHHLVRGKAIFVDEDNDWAEYVIERVYVGDKTLVEERFVAYEYTSLGVFQDSQSKAYPRKKGEVSLWWVKPAYKEFPSKCEKNTTMKFCGNEEPLPAIVGKFYYPFPHALTGNTNPGVKIPSGALKSHNNLDAELLKNDRPHLYENKDVVEFVEYIEKVWKEKNRATRIQWMKEGIFSKNSLVSAWSISTLGQFEDGRIFRYLAEINLEPLSVRALVKLDWAMSYREGTRNWLQTPTHDRILEEIAKKALTIQDIYFAAWHVLNLCLHRHSAGKGVANLLRNVSKEGKLTVDEKRLVFLDPFLPCCAYFDDEDRSALFDVLVEFEGKEHSKALRERAAHVLYLCVPFTQKQRDFLVKMQAEVESEYVRDTLNYVLGVDENKKKR